MAVTFHFEDLPKKQQQLITTATELFFNHGVRRVTINEICRKANVSNMTYYKYFSDKWDIAKTVLDILFDEVARLYKNIIEEDIPFSHKVEKLLMVMSKEDHTISSELKDDLLNKDSPLHSYVLEQQKKHKEMPINFLKKAQKEGYIQSDINIHFLIFIWKSYCNLLDNPDFAQIIPNLEERTHELAKIFLRAFAKTG